MYTATLRCPTWQFRVDNFSLFTIYHLVLLSFLKRSLLVPGYSNNWPWFVNNATIYPFTVLDRTTWKTNRLKTSVFSRKKIVKALCDKKPYTIEKLFLLITASASRSMETIPAENQTRLGQKDHHFNLQPRKSIRIQRWVSYLHPKTRFL